MQKVGVVIDNWKLPIFKRHLDEAGFAFEQFPNLTPNTMVLTIQTPQVAALQPVIERANKECQNQ